MLLNKILVHICCSVDSSFFIKELQFLYPDAKIFGYFYDPNIHPYSEYYLRMIDAKRSCKRLGVEFIEGEYEYQNWLEAIRGLENEPERGKRCLRCFDNRLESSAKKAKELKISTITTTLLMSPKKEFSQLKNSAKKIEKEYNIKFLLIDFRKNGGTQRQFALSKEEKNYHQNYCGCMFGLKKQREYQKKYTSELISPINNIVLPGSIEERIALYEKRVQLEEKNISYKIIKEKFINYRLLYAKVKDFDSFFLPYSKTKRFVTKTKIDFIHNNIAYCKHDLVKIITLDYFNKLSLKKFKSIKELVFAKIDFKTLLNIRKMITSSEYSTEAIVILKDFPENKIEIFLKSEFFDDEREILVYV